MIFQTNQIANVFLLPEITNMARLSKDQKLINDNPNASPYELQQMGLSDEAYNNLLLQQKAEQEVQDKPAKVKPFIEPEPMRAMPHLSIPAAAMPDNSQAYLVSPTGQRTLMSRTAATRWAQKHTGYTVE